MSKTTSSNVVNIRAPSPGTSPRKQLKLVETETEPEADAPRKAKRERAPNPNLIMEDSAAQQFAERYRDLLLYCHSAGAWSEWTGVRWKKNEVQLAFHWARELARETAKHEPDNVRYIAGRAAFAAAVERLARADPVFARTHEFWDKNPYLLGTPANPVDLRTGKLVPADPAQGITKITSVAPADTADCPLWLRFLDETTGGDDKLIRFLQQFIGYCLTGDVKEHALVFGYGSGGNGKTVFLNTVAGVIGEYAATASTDTFAFSKFEKHTTDIAMLRGSRFVTCSETEQGKAWAESRIKQMTGGDPITARFMRQDNFTFKPQFKLFIVGNYQPILHNVDDAAKRRFCIVPFTRTPAEPDRDLEAKLKAEWPGILRWAIEGCLHWQRNGLIKPRSVNEATEEYFESQDVFKQWLETCCDEGPQYSTRGADLWDSWFHFSEEAHDYIGTQKAFSQKLQQRGFTNNRTNRDRIYKGLKLKGPKIR